MLRKIYSAQNTSRSEKKIYRLVCECLDQYDMDRSVQTPHSLGQKIPSPATLTLLCGRRERSTSKNSWLFFVSILFFNLKSARRRCRRPLRWQGLMTKWP